MSGPSNNSTSQETKDEKVFNGEVNTKIACLNCRDKKLRCDKVLPECTRCVNKHIPCVYVEHKKTGPKKVSHFNSRIRKPNVDKPLNPDESIKKTLKQHTIDASKGNDSNEGNGNNEDNDNNSNENNNDNDEYNINDKNNKNDKEDDLIPKVLSPNNPLLSSLYHNTIMSSTSPSSTTYNQYKYNQTSNATNGIDNSNQSPQINNTSNPFDSNSKFSLQGSIDPLSPYESIYYNQFNQRLVSNSTTDIRNEDDPNIKINPIIYKKSDNNNANENVTEGILEPNFYNNLSSLTNKSFEEVIGLPKLGLTMKDVDKFHEFYFDSNTRIFKYSIPRYYNKFLKEPKQILHYSYMIWTIACFYLDQYEYLVDRLYQASLNEMNEYWESNRDSFHSDILTYLHALCLKSQFEFLSSREMRAALTISSSVRLTQMYGYDQIDLSPTTLNTPAIFLRSFSMSSNHFESTNILLQDDNIDSDIPLVEERRRVLWEVYAIDKWSSLVTGLPCILSVDNLSVIFTKLPSPTTFLPLNNDADEINEINENEQSSYYLHEAMQKLDNNQVLLDINSSSSTILLLTISENIIKWCKMFLNMVELETLKNSNSINSIRNKVEELVRNFESMHNNLLFFDLTTEPLMNIVITNTSTLLYQSVLIKFSSLFDLQLKEDPTGSTIGNNEIQLFKDILYEVSAISEKLVLRFMKKPNVENHLKKAPIFIVFINSIKSLFQCLAFVYKFNVILKVDESKKLSLLNTIQLTLKTINSMPGKTPLILKTKAILNNGQEVLNHSPHLLSFFDSFFDSGKTY